MPLQRKRAHDARDVDVGDHVARLVAEPEQDQRDHAQKGGDNLVFGQRGKHHADRQRRAAVEPDAEIGAERRDRDRAR